MSLLFNHRSKLCCLFVIGALLLPELLEAQTSASSTAMPGGEALPAAIPAEVKFMLATLGGGGIAGWAVGFTFKKVAKLLALVVGVAFISLQILAFNSFITIDWARIKSAVPDDSIEKSASGVMSVITYNLPFAGSFLVGFWLGFRKG